MIVLFLLAGLIIPSVLAVRGVGYRGVYVAAALVGLALGVFALSMSSDMPAAATAAERAGQGFIDEYASDFGGSSIVTAFGCLVAAALYRPRRVVTS